MALLCVILINAGFFLFSIYLDLARPVLNFDYIFALLVLVLGWRWVGLLLSIWSVFIDLLVIVSQILPFPRITDLVYLLGFSGMASNYHVIIIVLVTLAVVAKLSGFFYLSRRVSLKSSLLLLNLMLGIQMYLVYADDRDINISYRMADATLFASQSATFLSMRSGMFTGMFSHDSTELTSRPPGATGMWFEEIGINHIAPRLLLVVVESWGVPHDAEMQKTLLNPLRRLPLAYWHEGVLRGSGSTLDGELRELCQLQSSSYNLTGVMEQLSPCLPNLLKRKGYATAAFHGATGMMYDRYRWYPAVGFQQQIFFEGRIWPRRCYSFPGACDMDMLPEIERFFEGKGSRLLYWLTLNSHSPYDFKDITDGPQFDCAAYSINVNSEVCRNLLLHAQFFAGFARLLSSASMAGVDVILVGDHVPVIMNVADRQKYFRDSAVPWVRLVTAPSDRETAPIVEERR